VEEEGKDPIAVESLIVLNSAVEDGLWGGNIKVFEAGMPSFIKHANFRAYPGISSPSIVDYFLALTKAVLFVGAELSCFSTEE
jgi:hypothetical protein